MKKAVSYKFDDKVVDKLEQLSECMNMKKGNVIEYLIREHYDFLNNNIGKLINETMILDDIKFKVLVEKALIFDTNGGVSEVVLKIIANEQIDTENYFFKNKEVIYKRVEN